MKLIFGCGYLGSRVAHCWLQTGEPVRAVTRSTDKASALSAQGIQAVVADIRDRESLRSEIFADVETILFAVGFDRRGGTIHDVYVQGLANVLAGSPSSIKQIIYISTTGVYGRGAGETVDEQTAAHPERDGGKASLAAEELLRGSEWRERSLVLRLAGIYGPDRIPRAQDILDGKPITAQGTSWLNLIHVDDAAQIVLEASRRGITGEVFNVADGAPVERRDFYGELARLLQRPAPQFIEPSAEELAATRGGDKRVSNDKLVNHLQPKFIYPSYREGLASVVSTLRKPPE